MKQEERALSPKREREEQLKKLANQCIDELIRMPIPSSDDDVSFRNIFLFGLLRTLQEAFVRPDYTSFLDTFGECASNAGNGKFQLYCCSSPISKHFFKTGELFYDSAQKDFDSFESILITVAVNTLSNKKYHHLLQVYLLMQLIFYIEPTRTSLPTNKDICLIKKLEQNAVTGLETIIIDIHNWHIDN